MGRKGKKVYEYDLDGNILRSYKSISEAASENNMEYWELYRALDSSSSLNDRYWLTSKPKKYIETDKQRLVKHLLEKKEEIEKNIKHIRGVIEMYESQS